MDGGPGWGCKSLERAGLGLRWAYIPQWDGVPQTPRMAVPSQACGEEGWCSRSASSPLPTVQTSPSVHHLEVQKYSQKERVEKEEFSGC